MDSKRNNELKEIILSSVAELGSLYIKLRETKNLGNI